jgi:hypothetical protein
MATLNEIAYNIKNIAEGGVAPDDSNITLKQIKHMIHYHRANLLLKYTDNGRKTSEVMYQVHKDRLNGVGIDLKPFVGFNDNRAIRSIALRTVSSKNVDFELLPLFKEHDKMFAQSSMFIRRNSKKFATIQENKLFVYEGSIVLNLDFYEVEINAIYSNPTEISSYDDDDKTNYPFPEELINILVETILAKEYKVLYNTAADLPNNQRDEKTERRQAQG